MTKAATSIAKLVRGQPKSPPPMNKRYYLSIANAGRRSRRPITLSRISCEKKETPDEMAD